MDLDSSYGFAEGVFLILGLVVAPFGEYFIFLRFASKSKLMNKQNTK